jgi:hypothetical protein
MLSSLVLELLKIDQSAFVQVLAPTHGDALDSFDGEAVFRWQR